MAASEGDFVLRNTLAFGGTVLLGAVSILVALLAAGAAFSGIFAIVAGAIAIVGLLVAGGGWLFARRIRGSSILTTAGEVVVVAAVVLNAVVLGFFVWILVELAFDR
jgi:hypothetical protein